MRVQDAEHVFRAVAPVCRGHDAHSILVQMGLIRTLPRVIPVSVLRRIDVARILIIIGLGLALVGLLWPWLSKLPLGRLPGDISIERPNGRFYFPLASSLLVSAVVSLVMYWLGRKK